MIRKPKTGDVLYCVPREAYPTKPPFEGTVTKVGVKYFYLDNLKVEIDSFFDGSWVYRTLGDKSSPEMDVYLSKEIYEKQEQKSKQIGSILNEEFYNMSVYKIQKIYDLINETADDEGAEEWELINED